MALGEQATETFRQTIVVNANKVAERQGEQKEKIKKWVNRRLRSENAGEKCST